MYNFSESSKSRMQRFEEPHASREPQFGPSWHITFQLYDVLRFDSTVVIYVLTNISSPKLNNQIF